MARHLEAPDGTRPCVNVYFSSPGVCQVVPAPPVLPQSSRVPRLRPVTRHLVPPRSAIALAGALPSVVGLVGLVTAYATGLRRLTSDDERFDLRQVSWSPDGRGLVVSPYNCADRNLNALH
jgi:hypothetical protein